MPFARHLSARLARSGTRLRRDLAQVKSVEDQEAMHAARIRLKRQRALLAPFARSRPAIGAWFDQATRGQDLLGAIRDAHLLARRARKAGLPALSRAIEDTVLGHVSALEQDWVAQRDAAFAVLERAVAVLRSEGRTTPTHGLPMEIERKYLLRGCPPEARMVGPTRIEQGWIPGQALRERLRRRFNPDGTVSCWRTVKLGPAEARIEIEEATPPELFDAMWPLTRQARVRKERYAVPFGQHVWEIDVFLDRELVLAEVELSALHEVADLPPWIEPYVEREVTDEPAYFNTVLARPDARDA
jgi:CYTH domain-containing protein